jgi:hypothetical protein
MAINYPNFGEDVGILQSIPENKNILLKTHYLFHIKRLPSTSYFCNLVDVPGMNITAIDQPTIFNPIKRPGGAVEHDFLHVQFMLDENLSNWMELFNWIKECSDYTSFEDYRPPSKHFSQDARVYILNSDNQIQMKFTFDNLFPVRVGKITWDSKIKDSLPIYCDAHFAFTSYNVETI